jgi:hypothetical protein
MNKLFLIFPIVLLLATTSFGQKNDQTTIRESGKWKDIKIEKFGIQSLSIPDDWKSSDEGNTRSSKGDRGVTTTGFLQTWKNPADDFEVNIDITNWDSDLTKVTELPPDAATPITLLLLDLVASLNDKCKPGGRTEEADFYKVDGVRGTLTQSKWAVDKNRIFLAWQTYRYFENKPQKIMVWTLSSRSEITTARKIIESVKLQK